MKLVVDANILVAALLKDALTRELLTAFIRKACLLVSHPEDSPYIALGWALKIPLWSNDSALKQQPAVEILTTSELLGLLK